MFAAVGLLAGATSAHALDIRGVSLGDAFDPKILAAKLHAKGKDYWTEGFHCGKHRCHGNIEGSGHFTGNPPWEVTVTEKDGKVNEVEIEMIGDDHPFVLDSLQQKFGKPAYDGIYEPNNPSAIYSKVRAWTTPDKRQVIQLVERYEYRDYGSSLGVRSYIHFRYLSPENPKPIL